MPHWLAVALLMSVGGAVFMAALFLLLTRDNGKNGKGDPPAPPTGRAA